MFNHRVPLARSHRDTLAREISERAFLPTLEQLGHEAARMPLAELRGYVRGLAMPFAHHEAVQLVGREVPQDELRSLTAAALELVTHLVVRQFAAQPVASVPVPHIRLRIAA